MLQQLWDQHWQECGRDENLSSETSPVEGKADDGLWGLPVHALVVTHGAYMRVAIHHFVEDLDCPVPQGCDKAHMFSLCPNTGLCRFILTMRKEGDSVNLSGIRCVFVHRGDHGQQ